MPKRQVQIDTPPPDLWGGIIAKVKAGEYRPSEGWLTGEDFAARVGLGVKHSQTILAARYRAGELERMTVNVRGRRRYAYRPLKGGV